MDVRAVLLMVCIRLSTRYVHGQSLLKHGDQGCMKRIEDVEQKLASTVQQNIQLVRKLDGINRKFGQQNKSCSRKIQKLEQNLERQITSSTRLIQDLQRRQTLMNSEWPPKFQEFEKQLAGNYYLDKHLFCY